MAVTISSFGKYPDGREISLYTMENGNGMRVSVANIGAALVRVEVPDREGRLADVVVEPQLVLLIQGIGDLRPLRPGEAHVVRRVLQAEGDAVFSHCGLPESFVPAPLSVAVEVVGPVAT